MTTGGAAATASRPGYTVMTSGGTAGDPTPRMPTARHGGTNRTVTASVMAGRGATGGGVPASAAG